MSKKATIIAVVNQKGETGKTTTTENLGVGLALEGKKVLLVDTDPQASLTVSLGNPCPDDLSPTLSDLTGKIGYADRQCVGSCRQCADTGSGSIPSCKGSGTVAWNHQQGQETNQPEIED